MKTIDCTKDSAEKLFDSLRQKLSPRGDVVSEAGRKRTIELFGEPLTPQQVVERICGDVRQGGLPIVLDYTKKLDRKELTRETLRVSPAEFDAAFASADPEFLKTLGRIRDNIVEFQTKLLNKTVSLAKQNGDARIELRQRYLPLKRVGICIPGGDRVSVHAADDCCARSSRRRAGDRRRRAANRVRQLQPRSARGLQAAGHH